MKNDQLPVSIIIPVYNEAKIIEGLLLQLNSLKVTEIIIVDGGSTDDTIAIAKNYTDQIIHSKIRRRSYQMSMGAEKAKGEYLLFLHADVVLPEDVIFLLKSAVSRKIELANFSLRFDWNHWFLNLNAFFSKFKWSWFQFGDQGLFIKNSLFKTIKGYNNQLILAEGNEIIRRARKVSSFEKFDASLVVSARKYKQHGVYRLQFSYYLIYALIRFGVGHEQLIKLSAFKKKKR